MPSNRRGKAIGLVTLLAVCIIFYITHGASNTRNSEFYKKTVAAIQYNEEIRIREHIVAEEQQRLDRVERIAKEHSAALSAAAAGQTRAVGDGSTQTPIIPNGAYGAQKVADAQAGPQTPSGRRYVKDGKVVTYKSQDPKQADGVARVGNVDPNASHPPVPGEQYDKSVENALDEILRRSPIIIFSKSYCPYSMKAKHILMDMYSITPPPFVVELDQHILGTGLQAALEKLTGRRTVPNVMINGKSIGGGDDVAELHEKDTLAALISSMVGKRMTTVERKHDEVKREVHFKA